MSFTYGIAGTFQDIQPVNPRISHGCGFYILEFDLLFKPTNPPKGTAIVIDDFRVDVRVGPAQLDLGIAVPAVAEGIEPTIAVSNSQSGTQVSRDVRFRLNLLPSSLELVEKIRSGGDAIFDLHVTGTVRGHGTIDPHDPNAQFGDPWSANVLLNSAPSHVYKPVNGSCLKKHVVPQSEWIKLLEQAGYQRLLLFEIPIPDDDATEATVKHIRQARDAFNHGDYTRTIACCRDAMDSAVKPHESKVETVWHSACDNRKNMGPRERFALAWAATRHITHVSHHPGDEHFEFTRPMARYVLGAVCLALFLVGEESGIFCGLG